MRFAGTSQAGSSVLRSVPNAATYVLELVVVAAGYVGLTEGELILPWINPTATPLWPPSGLALALFLLRGYRIWPAILFQDAYCYIPRSGLLFKLFVNKSAREGMY